MTEKRPTGIAATTALLRKNLDSLETSQKTDPFMAKLRTTRALSQASIARLDGELGKRQLRRAIEAVLEKLSPASVPDDTFRGELALVLEAARMQGD